MVSNVQFQIRLLNCYFYLVNDRHRELACSDINCCMIDISNDLDFGYGSGDSLILDHYHQFNDLLFCFFHSNLKVRHHLGNDGCYDHQDSRYYF